MSDPGLWSESELLKILALPKAKQAAIGEAMELLIDAKRQELAAHRMLLRALQAEYTWWEVFGGATPKPGYYESRPKTYKKVTGCGNLDAAHRARRKYGLRYIYEVRPVNDVQPPTTQGVTHGIPDAPTPE